VDEITNGKVNEIDTVHGQLSIDFVLIELSEEQLRSIPPLYRAFLVGTSYVTNEILALTRAFILSANSSRLSPDPPIRALSATSMVVLNRALSGKIVEFLSLVADFEGRNRENRDDLAVKLRSEVLVELKALRKGRAFSVAKEVRNRLSHHYSFSDFLKYSETTGYQKSRLWLAEMEGNSAYQLGEEIVTHGFFSQWDDPEVVMNEWADWTQDASRLISSANSNVAIAIFEAFVPDVVGTSHRSLVPDLLFADVKRTPLPLLWYPFNAVGR
jgi:hypothetical protein